MKFRIRLAREQDYDQICSLSEELDQLHRQNLPEIFQKPAGPVRDIAWLRSLLRSANTMVCVAESEDGLLAGYAVGLMRNTAGIPILTPRKYVVVDTLVVRRVYQRTGIGRFLMDWIEGWATQNGATAIELNVYEFNQGALAFYETLGFETQNRSLKKRLE